MAELIFYTLIGTFFICLVIIIIARATSTNEIAIGDEAALMTPEQQRWLQKVEAMFRENKVLSFLDIYVECGMPKEIAYCKNSDTIGQVFPFDKNETRHDGYFTFLAYQWAVSERHRLLYEKLSVVDAERYGLNLHDNEVIYHRINTVTLLQEKTVRYNVIYSGIRWQSGMLRAGAMSMIGNEITRFTPVDIGRLFITGERILFVGKQNNVTKAIPIKDVLYYNLYQDGVLVNVPNRKPILFKFEVGYIPELAAAGDGVNEFIIVLNRIISGTENENLLE